MVTPCLVRTEDVHISPTSFLVSGLSSELAQQSMQSIQLWIHESKPPDDVETAVPIVVAKEDSPRSGWFSAGCEKNTQATNCCALVHFCGPFVFFLGATKMSLSTTKLQEFQLYESDFFKALGIMKSRLRASDFQCETWNPTGSSLHE